MATARRGIAAANTTAHANDTVAWPDGNEYVVGSRTIGSGSGSTTNGRSRPMTAFRSPDETSASSTASAVAKKTSGRRRATAKTAAIASQTRP
jgi:hypothetical protein